MSVCVKRSLPEPPLASSSLQLRNCIPSPVSPHFLPPTLSRHSQGRKRGKKSRERANKQLYAGAQRSALLFAWESKY